jgi:hypothetical protein
LDDHLGHGVLALAEVVVPGRPSASAMYSAGQTRFEKARETTYSLSTATGYSTAMLRDCAITLSMLRSNPNSGV